MKRFVINIKDWKILEEINFKLLHPNSNGMTEERNCARFMCQPHIRTSSTRNVSALPSFTSPSFTYFEVAKVSTRLYKGFIGLDGEMSNEVRWGYSTSFYSFPGLVIFPTSDHLM